MCAFVFLLQSRRESLESFRGFVDLLIGLLLLFSATLHALVLVSQLLTIELEQVGKILGALSGAGGAATAPTHADADVAEDGFCPLQLLQRALLRRECGLRVAAGELLFRRVHDRRRLIQNLGDLGEVAVARRDTAVDDAPRELLGLPAQLLLRYAQRRQILLQILRLLGCLVAQRIEGACDDLSLLLGELAGIIGAASAGTALLLLVVLREGADVQEIDVRRRRLRTTHGVVVRGTGIVRHDVTGLQLEILEREGVRGRHLRRAARRGIERLGLFGTTVHRIDEVQLLDAIVIVGLHFGVHFVDV